MTSTGNKLWECVDFHTRLISKKCRLKKGEVLFIFLLFFSVWQNQFFPLRGCIPFAVSHFQIPKSLPHIPKLLKLFSRTSTWNTHGRVFNKQSLKFSNVLVKIDDLSIVPIQSSTQSKNCRSNFHSRNEFNKKQPG